jgi:hypothetical protein
MRAIKMWQRTLTGVELVQRSWLDLGVPFEVRPVLVTADDAHLMNVVAMLKHQAHLWTVLHKHRGKPW